MNSTRSFAPFRLLAVVGLPEQRKSPDHLAEAPSKTFGGVVSDLSRSDLEALAARDSYVVRVVVTLANGQVRTQHYASLHSAVRAGDRARARGCTAVLALAQVVPVGLIPENSLTLVGGAR